MKNEPIERVAIPSRDGVDELRRSVGSCFSLARRGPLEIVVFDDSDAPSATRALLDDLARSAPAGVSLLLATRADRRQLVEALASSADEARVLEHALLGGAFASRYGAVRNAIALELSGHAFLSLDDDMSARAFRAPGTADVTFASSVAPATRAGDPTELWFFADERGPRACAERVAIDLLGAHEALLARDDVAATWTGFYGHCGTPSPFLFLAAEGLSFDRLARDGASVDAFDALARSGQILRAVPSPTIARGGFWTPGTAAYGADAAPPFLPVLRGEGLVFGAAVAACMPRVLGYVPVVVEHRSRARAGLAPGDFERAAHQRSLAPIVAGLLHLVAHTVRAADGARPDPVRVGRALVALADEPSSFVEAVRMLQRARTAAMVGRLRERLARDGARCAPFGEAAARFLRAAESAGDGVLVPHDLAAEIGDADPVAAMRDVVASYGRLLVVWERLHDRARALHERGLRTATLVG
jgi:hypothetical protein